MRILLLLMRFPYLINGAFTPPAAKSGTPPHHPPTQVRFIDSGGLSPPDALFTSPQSPYRLRNKLIGCGEF